MMRKTIGRKLDRRYWFVSFADSRLTSAIRRIARQARRIGFEADRINVVTEKDLYRSFKTEMASHLVLGSRGFGYWCWRPQVVLQMFDQMGEGDILLFCDVGCHLNPKGLPRLKEYYKIADDSEILAFQYRSLLGTQQYDPLHHFCNIGRYTKGDVLDYFGVRNDKSILLAGQYAGGVFLVKKTARTMAFYREYRQIITEHFNFIDDSPSVSENLLGFKGHRHDQALFTLLCMKEGVETLSACEFEYFGECAPECYKGNPEWARSGFNDMKEFPIHAKRDKPIGLKSLLPYSIRLYLGSKLLRLKQYRIDGLFKWRFP